MKKSVVQLLKGLFLVGNCAESNFKGHFHRKKGGQNFGKGFLILETGASPIGNAFFFKGKTTLKQFGGLFSKIGRVCISYR